MKKIKITIACITLGALIWVSTAFTDSYFEISKNLDIFSTLYRELNIYYVDETNPGKLMTTGINSMVESLDPYTTYIPESEIEDYRFMTTGQYGGIGALISQKGDFVVVADPYEGYPAFKADLRAGDIILEIDGRSSKGKKTDEVSKILKGQPNTQVKLLIRRYGEKNPMEKVITREEIKINSVSYSGMVGPSTGYIRLTSFTEHAGKEVRDALQELKKNPEMKNVILDLRGNPGGLLHEAVNISNIFVDKGLEVVSTKGKVKEWDKSYKSLNQPLDLNIPVAVLVNSSSASASEIVSGSLQDLDRAIVIGQRTFGKGLVQTTRPLSYNSQLKITTAKYYVPSGRCIQALDYSNRNEDGSVGSVPDSLVKPFKTKGGRVVYDGGGILPDHIVELQKYSNISISLLSKNHIFDFATLYRFKNNSIPEPKKFNITEVDFQEFVSFLTDKDYDYVTKSEKALEELKENAQNEKYFDQLTVEYDALRKKMMHDKQRDLIKHKEEIKQLLREEIVSRYYFQKGRTEVAFENDQDLKEARGILNNQSQYVSILKGTYKQNVPK